MGKSTRWARHFSCCKRCGTVALPHWAKGLCSVCYHRKGRVARKAEGWKSHREFTCLTCGKDFSPSYRVASKNVLRFCSKKCSTIGQRTTTGSYRNKTQLESAIKKLITTQGKYRTREDILNGLSISSKTLSRFRISIQTLNRGLGMSPPKRVFETKVGEYLTEIFPDLQSHVSFDDCLSPKGYLLQFDFYCPAARLLFEADGTQHTDRTNPWYSDYYAECDSLKEDYALGSGMRLIRIPYTKRVTAEFVSDALASALSDTRTMKAPHATTQSETINVNALKNCGDRSISSQAMVGKGSMEGSTTRRTSPNSNSAHERPALYSHSNPYRSGCGGYAGDDIVCSTVKTVEGGIKSPSITQGMEQIEGMSVTNSRAIIRGQRV